MQYCSPPPQSLRASVLHRPCLARRLLPGAALFIPPRSNLLCSENPQQWASFSSGPGVKRGIRAPARTGNNSSAERPKQAGYLGHVGSNERSKGQTGCQKGIGESMNGISGQGQRHSINLASFNNKYEGDAFEMGLLMEAPSSPLACLQPWPAASLMDLCTPCLPTHPTGVSPFLLPGSIHAPPAPS